jgi:glycosyltransferase involved in cell wall biosynthesis
MIVASHAFSGLRGRQQQFALGLAEAGHAVVYLEPGGAGTPETAEAEIASTAVGERLIVLGPAAGGEGTIEATRAAGEAEAEWVARVIEGGLPGDAGRLPEATIVYPPAVIPRLRELLAGALVFDCEEDFPATAPSRAAATYYEEALEEALPRVDGLVAVNRYLVGSWGRLLRSGVPSAVIEHGADLDLFQPAGAAQRAAAREALELPAETPVAAFVGRFDARVSFEDLQHTLDQSPELLFLLLGEANDEGEAILQRLPAARIVRRGPLPQEEVAAALAAADLILIPLRREPHLEPQRGLALYEYLATGLPVVGAFRRGVKAFRELCYLYTTREELDASLQGALAEGRDDPLRERRIATAREAGWGRRVEELATFLQRVAGD